MPEENYDISEKKPNFLGKFKEFTGNFIKEAFIPPKRASLVLEEKETPLLNEPITATRRRGLYSTQPYNYKNLWTWLKKTPEAIGIMQAIITDIVSDGYELEGHKVNKNKAEQFMKQVFFKETFKAGLWDWISLGDCALWKGPIVKVNDLIKEKVTRLDNDIEYKTDVAMELKQSFDEDEFLRFKHVAWSTMSIDHDEEKITGFVQTIAGKKRVFDPKEIIHGKFITWDGKAYGYSPFIASISVVSTLGLMKDYNGTFFDRGGFPDLMFNFPEEGSPNSPNVRLLIQRLEKYKEPLEKHGNMVTTGKLAVERLNEWNKDMEFRLLAVYYTGVLALAFNMPMSRVAAIVGAEVRAGSEDLSDSGYWRKISEAQDYWEQLLNTQLFEPYFKVQLKFKRAYLQDEVREMMILMNKSDIYTKWFNSGLINQQGLFHYLKIPEKFRGKPQKIQMPQARGTPAQRPNRMVLEGPNQQVRDEAKRKQQLGL